MADYRAIAGVCEAVVGLLRTSCCTDDFNNELEFKLFTSKDFAENTIANGASLFMYRIFCSGAHRIPPGRIDLDGRQLDSKLPLELHFLITIWGKDASLQYALAGWIMRVLEDTPVLPAGVLNSAVPNVFHPDETVEIGLADLRTEDLFRIWDVLGLNVYQLSIPYMARVVHIDSTQQLRDAGLVQEREFEAAVFEPVIPGQN